MSKLAAAYAALRAVLFVAPLFVRGLSAIATAIFGPDDEGDDDRREVIPEERTKRVLSRIDQEVVRAAPYVAAVSAIPWKRETLEVLARELGEQADAHAIPIPEAYRTPEEAGKALAHFLVAGAVERSSAETGEKTPGRLAAVAADIAYAIARDPEQDVNVVVSIDRPRRRISLRLQKIEMTAALEGQLLEAEYFVNARYAARIDTTTEEEVSAFVQGLLQRR